MLGRSNGYERGGELGMRGRRSTFAWLAAALLLVAAVSTAGAAKNPEGTLTPLLAEVTEGGNAAFSSTYSNTGKTQTHSEFHMPIPEGNDEPVYASCPHVLTATELVCNRVKLAKGQIARVTVVWLANESEFSAYWSVDSGSNSPTKPKKRVDVGPVEISLLAEGDAGKASSYVLMPCAPDPTLETDPEVDEGNPLATRVCIPPFATNDNLLPGLLGSVSETDVDETFPQQSSICLAVQSCATPFQFSTPITFTFFLHEDSFQESQDLAFEVFDTYWDPEPLEITVFHDGLEVDPCTDSGPPDPCVDSIVSDDGTATIVAKGTENGDWTFG
jgi:hypothetical protein